MGESATETVCVGEVKAFRARQTPRRCHNQPGRGGT